MLKLALALGQPLSQIRSMSSHDLALFMAYDRISPIGPERIDAGVGSLDLVAAAHMDFEAPNELAFPCLRLAKQAAQCGQSYSTVLNAANEVAVEAFLNRQLAFTQIADVNASCLDSHVGEELDCLDSILSLDARTRSNAQQLISHLKS